MALVRVLQTSRIPRVILPLAVMAVISVGIGVATGAIPTSDGQIHGCYTKAGGALRVIDVEKNQGCKPVEEPISWNQQGPQGEPGPPGTSGGDPALWAIVRGADGNLLAGSHVATSVRNFEGSYTIVFDQSIPGQGGGRLGCAVNVTPTSLDGDFTTHTRVTPIVYAGSATTIHVENYEGSTTVDQSFSLAVSC